jgi:hypothetical protein
MKPTMTNPIDPKMVKPHPISRNNPNRGVLTHRSNATDGSIRVKYNQAIPKPRRIAKR